MSASLFDSSENRDDFCGLRKVFTHGDKVLNIFEIVVRHLTTESFVGFHGFLEAFKVSWRNLSARVLEVHGSDVQEDMVYLHSSVKFTLEVNADLLASLGL